MVVQSTIDEKGETQKKFRLTHDQSFNPKGIRGRSVNDRVGDTTLTPARFGKAFSRLLYHISFLRLLWPDEPIYLTKVDFKSAYRRIHLQIATASKSGTCIDEMLLIALRLTFSGSPNPSLWSDVSEVITDRANDVVRRTDWDPKRHHSPHQHLLSSEKAIDGDANILPTRDGLGRAYIAAPDLDIYDALPRFDCYLEGGGLLIQLTFALHSSQIRPIHLLGSPTNIARPPTFARRSVCLTILTEGRLTRHHARSPPLGRTRLARSCPRCLGPPM